MKKLIAILSIAFLPSVTFAQHYIYYSGGYGYGNSWHMPFFLLVLIPIVWFIFCVLMFILWLWMLIDAIKYAPEKMKIVWIIVIIFTSIIGALIYYFVEKRPRLKIHHHHEENK